LAHLIVAVKQKKRHEDGLPFRPGPT
jgi:hypothetical protein